MRIAMMKLKVRFFIFLFLFSTFFSFDIKSNIFKALRDSADYNVFNLLTAEKKELNNPDYLFLSALLEFNGDSASKKYKNFYYKYPKYEFSDYVISELGSYYYSKGYYVQSSNWFKKIPMYHRDSKLINESIEMFFNTLIVSGSIDSVVYYNDIFSKLYPNLEIKLSSINLPIDLKLNKSDYDSRYTIQIGAFKEYSRAQSRMHMLNSEGFSVRIDEEKADGSLLYLIREGNYSTKKSAEKISSRIRARTGLKTIIIEL